MDSDYEVIIDDFLRRQSLYHQNLKLVRKSLDDHIPALAQEGLKLALALGKGVPFNQKSYWLLDLSNPTADYSLHMGLKKDGAWIVPSRGGEPELLRVELKPQSEELKTAAAIDWRSKNYPLTNGLFFSPERGFFAAQQPLQVALKAALIRLLE